MAFTVEEFRDLLRILEEQPEWRAELRRLVLTDELLTIPQLMRALVEAQQRTEERLATLTEAQQRTEERLATLTEAQQRTEERLATLTEAQQRTEERLATLTEAQQRTEERLATLTEAQQRTEERLATLTEAQQRTEERLATLTEAQQRTEERLATLTEAQQRTEERLATLTEAQQRLEERVAMIEERMAALIAAQQRTDERLEALIDTLQALTLRVDSLTRSVSNLHDDASKLKGYALENRYRSHAQAYFAPVLRRIRIIGGEELETLMERAVEAGQLSESEALDMVLADVVARGRRRDDNTEVYLVVEVSWRVDPYDVERAVRRSSLLSRTGTPAFAVVAGETVIEEAANLADRLHVWQVTDGHVVAPPDGSPQHPC